MAFCGNCGKEVKDGVKFCGSCGAPVGAATGTPAANNVAVSEPVITSNINSNGVESDEPDLKGLSNVWAWCMAFVPLMGFVLACIIVVVAPGLANYAMTIGCIPLFLLFYLLDDNELKKRNIDVGWGWTVWGILLCGFLVGPIYLFSRAKNIGVYMDAKGKYGYAVASLVAPVVILLIPAVSSFSDASAKAKMTEAPRAIASFESAYLAALAENGDDADITDKELIFMMYDDSKLFKYEYVTYPQGGIAGLKATASKNIGEFNKGDYLQTVIDDGKFTHCVGGTGADVSVVEELIPNFNATVECSSVEVRKASTFTDSRDGKKYKIVKISNQTWMAENLNFAAKNSVCYENNAEYCARYGRLYNWNTARNACPAGFHLPRDAEWTTLVNNAGGESTAGKKLKSKNGWAEDGSGTNEYGFSALPGGIGIGDGSFTGVGGGGVWWSATGNDTHTAWDRMITSDEENVDRDNDGKAGLFSVRCVQDQ
jgi:uncharacterized protein (TIGR02145 family)